MANGFAAGESTSVLSFRWASRALISFSNGVCFDFGEGEVAFVLRESRKAIVGASKDSKKLPRSGGEARPLSLRINFSDEMFAFEALSDRRRLLLAKKAANRSKSSSAPKSSSASSISKESV